MQHSVAPFRFRTAVCQGFLIVVFMLLAGCSGPLVKSAITSNIVQEEAHNAYLLLNIIRAQERMPMHFTQVSAVRAAPGGIGIGTPAVAFELPLGGGSDHSYKFNPSIQSTSNVDTTSLVSQEFMRGITSPVNEKLMVYFANQGWPQAMILHLFVGAIEITDTNGRPIYTASNSIYNSDTGGIFRQVAKELARCVPTLIEKKKYTYYSGVLAEADLEMEKIAAMKDAGLELIEVDSKGAPVDGIQKPRFARFATIAKEEMLAFTEVGSLSQGLVPVPCSVNIVDNPTSDLEKLRDAFDKQNRAIVESKESDPKLPKIQVRFVMRSAQSMLYFLGELSRKRNSEILTIPIRDGEQGVLFVTRCCDKLDDSSVGIEYQTKSYSLFPSNTTLKLEKALNGDLDVRAVGRSADKDVFEDRSLQTLALVSLVYGLQNQSGEAPSIRNVRVIP